jgi:hypothetical protein
MTVVDFTFPHLYACEVLDELPGGRAPQHDFPGDRAAGGDGVVVRVQPEAAATWIGMFAFGTAGRVGATRVVSMPDPAKLCVVARGAGYVVTSANPDVWEEVPAIPIIDVRGIPGAGLMVFANHTELLAYGKAGVKWRTKRLAWDGFDIVSITDQTLVGEYWDIREESVRRFEVDLASGAARGGVQ